MFQLPVLGFGIFQEVVVIIFVYNQWLFDYLWELKLNLKFIDPHQVLFLYMEAINYKKVHVQLLEWQYILPPQLVMTL